MSRKRLPKARKVTDEQVAHLNRALLLRGVQGYCWRRGEDGRLQRVECLADFRWGSGPETLPGCR